MDDSNFLVAPRRWSIGLGFVKALCLFFVMYTGAHVRLDYISNVVMYLEWYDVARTRTRPEADWDEAFECSESQLHIGKSKAGCLS